LIFSTSSLQEGVCKALDGSDTVRQTAKASIHFQDCNEMALLSQNSLADALRPIQATNLQKKIY
jgi:hypothetical protein